jgi:hypothetical protein
MKFTIRSQLWGTASTSNIEILERFQSKALRKIEDAPWYVPNTVIRKDLQTLTVKEEIRKANNIQADRTSWLISLRRSVEDERHT